MDKVVTIAKARRLLGKRAQELSDDQVRQMIHMLHLFAREQTLYNGSKVGQSNHESNQPEAKT